MLDDYTIFLFLLPLVAFLYAAVGHGGASGYLALMALFSFDPSIMKQTGLLLNIFVAGISFYYYWKEGYFNKKLFAVFAVSSIPLAFIGGLIEVDVKIYKVVLGALLFFAIFKMLGLFGKEREELRKIGWLEGTITGSIIGFFSGLIGIGGGIILSPVILIFRWGKMKEAAAVSALFIWVNSIAGMIGQLSAGVRMTENVWLFVALAVVGGSFGAYFGSKKISNNALRYLLAFVLILASAKLFFL